MKNAFARFFASRELMGLTMVAFAFCIAIATFIENDFGNITARIKVYDAWWFKLLLLVFCLNLIGVIFHFKLYQRAKISIFLFHLAFIFIILGAAITRYIGYEGQLSVREGDSTRQMVSTSNYITVRVRSTTDNTVATHFFKMKLAPQTKNRFKKTFHTSAGAFRLKLDEYSEQEMMQSHILSKLVFTITSGTHTQQLNVMGRPGMLSRPFTVQFENAVIDISYGAILHELPFEIYLDDFILERYPGSNSPSWYESRVILKDTDRNIEKPYRIFMNHILKYRGYRFFQSSYDDDEQGTILSVTKDPWGTRFTYLGYLLMTLGMLTSLFTASSRFRKLTRSRLTLLAIGVGLSTFANLSAQDTSGYISQQIPPAHTQAFSEIMVQDINGRIKPVYTHASEILRKVYRKNTYQGLSPVEVLLDIYLEPQKWLNEPMVKIGHPSVSRILGIDGKYASVSDFFHDGDINRYKILDYSNAAYHKKPAYRDKFDNELIRVDERLNVLLTAYNASILNIFPSKTDSASRWFSPVNNPGHFTGQDSVVVRHIFSMYVQSLQKGIDEGDFTQADEILNGIKEFQRSQAGIELPSDKKLRAEITFFKSNIFHRLSNYYLLIGFALLLFQFYQIFNNTFRTGWIFRVSAILLLVCFILHTYGLAALWVISGHAPWSNGYEALLFISWATVLAGFIFSFRSQVTLSATALVAALILVTAHLSWIDPQLTPLVPVLKSYWLIIHVAIITSSYGFLALGALVAAINLILLFFESAKNSWHLKSKIDQLSRVIEMSLIVGLYLLTIGTFLGGVWANESWGRYWGWDPKETWALITVLVYAFILHMRIIPGFNHTVLFNFMALAGFSSVLMTYFGVNYYLSGLHSYAAGDPLPVPVQVYYAIATILILGGLAWYNQHNLKKPTSTAE